MFRSFFTIAVTLTTLPASADMLIVNWDCATPSKAETTFEPDLRVFGNQEKEIWSEPFDASFILIDAAPVRAPTGVQLQPGNEVTLLPNSECPVRVFADWIKLMTSPSIWGGAPKLRLS